MVLTKLQPFCLVFEWSGQNKDKMVVILGHFMNIYNFSLYITRPRLAAILFLVRLSNGHDLNKLTMDHPKSEYAGNLSLHFFQIIAFWMLIVPVLTRF